MKKYELLIITGNHLNSKTVFAEYFDTTTNNNTFSGYYAFYADKKIVSCYPIERTIIASIEELEEDEF